MNGHSPLKVKPLRNPGQSLDDELQAVFDDGFLPYFLIPCFLWLIAGMEWFANFRNTPRSPGLYAALALLFSLICVVKLFQLRKKVRALKLGRDGERVVGQFLDGLRETGARIFHDVPGDGFNLDHVVVSEHGVFVVETKTRSKRSPSSKVTFSNGVLLVDGFKPDRDAIKQAQSAAAWLKQLLIDTTGKKFNVRPVIVFPGWLVEPMPVEIKKSVWVLEPKALPAFIEHERKIISPSDVALAAHRLGLHIRGSGST